MEKGRVRILREMFEEARKEYMEVAEELKPLLRQRNKLEDKISHLEALLEAEGYDMNREGHKGRLELFGESAISGEEARYQIAKILKDYPDGLHYREIYKKLEDRGYKMKGKEPAINLIAHMSNDREERFESLSKGVWKLKGSK
jgi:hypothetical protein